MGVWQQSPIKSRFKIDGSASNAIFSSATGTRWVLCGGAIGWENASGISQFSFIETWDSVSTIFFHFDTSTSNGFINFDLGGVGIQASETYSGLKLAVDVGATGTGSYSAFFSGFVSGG